MTDDIIKEKLKEVGLSYKLSPKYFQIPREIIMDPKAPKWFEEFEKRNNKRLDKIDNRLDTLASKVDKNTEMILKAHPEFKK